MQRITADSDMERISRTPPIRYIDRTRAYYLALGYETPYRWAQFADVPFRRPAKPVTECVIGLVTTAAPFQPGKGDQGPGAAYNAAAKFFQVYDGATDTMPDVRISHVAIDRDHTTAEDVGTYFPLAALKQAAVDGQIRAVGPRFYGLPTNRSQRVTTESDCPDLLRRIQRDRVDAVVLVANCPVCHQSVALAARALETAGIPTVVMGCAKDIVEHVGVSRFLFSDFPLGNAAGRPNDPVSQAETLAMALDLLGTATEPRSTVVSPQVWPGPEGWKEDYSNPAKLSPDEIARRRAEFDRAGSTARSIRSES